MQIEIRTEDHADFEMIFKDQAIDLYSDAAEYVENGEYPIRGVEFDKVAYVVYFEILLPNENWEITKAPHEEWVQAETYSMRMQDHDKIIKLFKKWASKQSV